MSAIDTRTDSEQGGRVERIMTADSMSEQVHWGTICDQLDDAIADARASADS